MLRWEVKPATTVEEKEEAPLAPCGQQCLFLSPLLLSKENPRLNREEKKQPHYLYISPANAETLLANSIVQKVMLSFVLFLAPTFCVAVVPLEEEKEEEERGGEAFSPGGGRRRRQKQQAVGEEGEER